VKHIRVRSGSTAVLGIAMVLATVACSSTEDASTSRQSTTAPSTTPAAPATSAAAPPTSAAATVDVVEPAPTNVPSTSTSPTAPPTSTTEAIEATGTIPPSTPPAFGTPQADGSLPFTATYTLEGDLAGTVSGAGTLSFDSAKSTFTQHETTATFDGTLAGVGHGTLTFVTTIPETSTTAPAVETGSVSGGTGDLAGLVGTIELRYTVTADGSPGPGSYTVTLTEAP
jgi:hypothetical protein